MKFMSLARTGITCSNSRKNVNQAAALVTVRGNTFEPEIQRESAAAFLALPKRISGSGRSHAR